MELDLNNLTNRERVYREFILYYMHEAIAPSLDQLVELTGIPRMTVNHHITQMVKEGILRQGEGRRSVRPANMSLSILIPAEFQKALPERMDL